jgi:hypothetical protein
MPPHPVRALPISVKADRTRIEARHGGLPPVRVADKELGG